jgi:hypothetical protein
MLLLLGPIVWLIARGHGRRDAALLAAFLSFATTQWFDYELSYWFGGALLGVLLLAQWLTEQQRVVAPRHLRHPLTEQEAVARVPVARATV